MLTNEELNTLTQLGLEPKIPLTIEQLDDNESLTVGQIADQFKISKETVRRWCREGHLEMVSIGQKFLIRASSLKNLAKRKAPLSSLQKQVLQ